MPRATPSRSFEAQRLARMNASTRARSTSGVAAIHDPADLFDRADRSRDGASAISFDVPIEIERG